MSRLGTSQTNIYEIPTCPVCLERMDSAVTGLITVPCSHTFHCMCLSKWGDSRYVFQLSVSIMAFHLSDPSDVLFVGTPKPSCPHIPPHQQPGGQSPLQTLRLLVSHLAHLAVQRPIYGYASSVVPSDVDGTVWPMPMPTMRLPHTSMR